MPSDVIGCVPAIPKDPGRLSFSLARADGNPAASPYHVRDGRGRVAVCFAPRVAVLSPRHVFSAFQAIRSISLSGSARSQIRVSASR
jgi:hypothetical protein